jgi:hypothetical protein
MQQSSVRDNLLMSCLEHWWMPRDELSFLYGITDQSIDPDFGQYEPD